MFPTRYFIFMMIIIEASSGPLPDERTAHLSRPNRPEGLERFLGLGVVLPYPYFQKPQYRFPVYDREGRGYLAYGYGGKETFRYTKFDQSEGHH
ncbi:uncharacterized protein LOC110863314 [Folsomia candida]|uniref:uncharacterized protein LOC110863314 n=1 Tax=Folsomia candida TaxID=158441 RepID=UPI000B8F044B|nr:uncharacterized protein LOC110863314 [Folsomia candida]